MYKTRHEFAGIEVGQIVLAPHAEEWVQAPTSQCAVIPFKTGLKIAADAIGTFEIRPVFNSSFSIKNESADVVLAALVSFGPRDALWVFGSRAHGSHRAKSDLDVMIVYEGETKGYKSGSIVIHFENRQQLLSRAQNGELFVRYLTQGARPISDPGNDLELLCSHYCDAADYTEIRAAALQLLFFLAHPAVLCRHTDFVIGKVLWAVRTVLMAEGHDPFTALDALNSNDQSVLQIVHDAKYSKDRISCAKGVQTFLDLRRFSPEQVSDFGFHDWKTQFASMGQKFVSSILDDLSKLETNRQRKQAETTSNDTHDWFWAAAD